MDRSQIKMEAKQKITSDFGKMALPVWAGLLWGLIIGLIVAVVAVIAILTRNVILAMIIAIPFVLVIIFFLLNLRLRQAEFYLKVARGEEVPTLKIFFNFSGSFGKMWILFKIRFMKIIFTFLAIFMPGYVSTLFYVDDLELIDNNSKDSKLHFVKIPRLTSAHIFELALVKLSFFWWNLLSIVTFGIANIFVSPYKNLTRAKIYEFLVDSYKKDEKIKKTFMQMAAGQTVCASQDDAYLSEDQDSLFVNAQIKLFAQVKQNFASCEGELSAFIKFENNYSNIEQCQNSTQILELLQKYNGALTYSTTKQFDKADCKALKQLLKNYKSLSSKLGTIEDSELISTSDKMREIIADRMSVIEFEIMRLQKVSLQSVYGGRLLKLKEYIKKSSERSNSQRFGEACTAQLKVEKKAFSVLVAIMLAIFMVCVVMPIGVTLATAPLEEVTVDGVVYKKEYSNSNYYFVSEVKNKKNEIIIKDKVRGLPVQVIGKYAFLGRSDITKITLPNSIVSIYGGAFNGCSGLKNITIPNSVYDIAGTIFYGCDSLESITLPFIGIKKDLEYYSAREGKFSLIFGGYSSGRENVPESLKTVIISNSGVTEIADYAFAGCENIESITIPECVKSIGKYAFQNCSSLETINFNGTMGEWKDISKGYSWTNNTGDFTIICTDGKLDKNSSIITT